MKFSLLITSSPFETTLHESALRFAKAALADGHTIQRIFFYKDAVLAANAMTTPPQGQTSAFQDWQDFSKQTGVTLHACIANSLRRGIVDSTEAERYQLTGSNLGSAFSLVGLGEMTEVMSDSDKLVQF